MPMDKYTHYLGEPDFAIGADAISELRLALIGNNDLKLRLVSDETFLRWFRKQFQKSLDSVVTSEQPLADLLQELHTQVIVLRILVTYAGSLSQASTEDGQDIASLQFCVPLLSKFIEYFLESFVSRFISSDNDKIAEMAEIIHSTVCDAFHVILVFANVLRLVLEGVSFESIWRLLTTLMVLTDGPASPSLSPDIEKVLISGLEMIPYCLERGPRDLTIAYAEGMLAVSLTRLYGELLTIHTSGFLASDSYANSLWNLTPVGACCKLLHDSKLATLTALAVGVVQMLNFLKGVGRTDVLPIEQAFFTSMEIYRSILVLLKYDDSQLLNVAALNLIRYYLAFLDDGTVSSESSVYSIFERLFPRIVELSEFDYSPSPPHLIPKYIQLPVSILSDLCLKNPEISVHLRNTNVDFKIMQELEKLFGQVSIFRQLHDLKSTARNANSLVDFTTLRKILPDQENEEYWAIPLLQSSQLDVISNYLLLLSVFTSSNEEFRRRITVYKSEQSTRVGPNFLCLMIFEIIDDFRFLVGQMLRSYNVFFQLQQQLKIDYKFLSWFGSNIGVLFTLLEHSIFSNTLYLIRSLSRSVSTLRTFFVDCNSVKSIFDVQLNAPEFIASDPLKQRESIVDIVGLSYDREISFERKGSFITSILEILSLLENAHSAMMYFMSLKTDFDSLTSSSRKLLCVKKVILLASIANFILDFSSFRYGIINHETFLRDLAVLYMNAMKAKQEHDCTDSKNDSGCDIMYEQLRVQLGVLQVVKNYLYNENEENRKFVWDFIPLSMIFDKSLYGIIDESEEDPKLHNLLLLHKIIAFEILRNLTAASAYFSEAIKDSFQEYVNEKHQDGQVYVPGSWNDYIFENLMCFDLFVDLDGDEETNEKRFFTDDEFLLTLIKDSDYVRLVVGINYLEDHRYANVSVFRKSDFPKMKLLDVWKRFLEVKLLDELEEKICGLNVGDRVKLSNQLSEIKVSVDWILINITWEDDVIAYQLPDKVNFRLLDTVSSSNQEEHATTASSSNLFMTSNIVIEESEEEDDEEEDDNDDGKENATNTNVGNLRDDNTIVTPKTRAKILSKHGFIDVLQRLIYEMSTPKYEPSRINRRSPLERFDNLNANDLYEKSKTAHYYITSLLSGSPHEPGKSHRMANQTKIQSRHPMRRSSNIISNRDGARIRRDINRDSEGLGNDSAQQLHPHYAQGEEVAHGNGNDTEAAASGGENDDEEIDEFWIR